VDDVDVAGRRQLLGRRVRPLGAEPRRGLATALGRGRRHAGQPRSGEPRRARVDRADEPGSDDPGTQGDRRRCGRHDVVVAHGDRFLPLLHRAARYRDLLQHVKQKMHEIRLNFTNRQ
jgi:hypothetical protein